MVSMIVKMSVSLENYVGLWSYNVNIIQIKLAIRSAISTTHNIHDGMKVNTYQFQYFLSLQFYMYIKV